MTTAEMLEFADEMRRRGATSIFVSDASMVSGRTAPFIVVIAHDTDRKITAQVVKDFVSAVRTQRYIPDNITLRRITAGGIR